MDPGGYIGPADVHSLLMRIATGMFAVPVTAEFTSQKGTWNGLDGLGMSQGTWGILKISNIT